jgi:hypothetical protein
MTDYTLQIAGIATIVLLGFAMVISQLERIIRRMDRR